MTDLPRVTIVFLVYNRREELRDSLQRMTAESDYPAELVDVIVVDNASEDGVSDMLRQEFPAVQLIQRTENTGVSGWNDGLEAATGEWVLLLDDDCYLPPDGLRRAVDGAGEHAADFVSFAVTSSVEPDHRFDLQYRTGLLAFWGCAALTRKAVLERIGGYDPNIFVWANEVEFMLRFYDAGFRHLHAPEIEAVHMKEVRRGWGQRVGRLGLQDALRERVVRGGQAPALQAGARGDSGDLTTHVRDGLRGNVRALTAIPTSLRGWLRGLRNRRPSGPTSRACTGCTSSAS